MANDTKLSKFYIWKLCSLLPEIFTSRTVQIVHNIMLTTEKTRKAIGRRLEYGKVVTELKWIKVLNKGHYRRWTGLIWC